MAALAAIAEPIPLVRLEKGSKSKDLALGDGGSGTAATAETAGADAILFGRRYVSGMDASYGIPQTTDLAAAHPISFFSAYLSFALNDPTAVASSYASLAPMTEIASDGLLASFFAEDSGTFSSQNALLVREPGGLFVFLAGVVCLGAMVRMRRKTA